MNFNFPNVLLFTPGPPLHIYMINGIEVSTEEFNEIPYGSTYEGIGVEGAVIRCGERGRNGAAIFNKRKESQ